VKLISAAASVPTLFLGFTVGVRMGFQFEFDSVNKVLLVRVEGPFTDQSLADCYAAIQQHSIATDARMGIFDMSAVTRYDVSSEFLRQVAKRPPAMPDATQRMRIIAVENTTGYGLARMFQIVGDRQRPKLQVVRTLDQALAALDVQSPHFEPLT
jgi:hypothetical protein